MIPGLGGIKAKMPKVFDVQETKLKKWRYAIDSMTPEERENPETLKSNRIARIAKGSNVSTSDIKALIKQHKLVKEFVSSSKGMQDINPSQMDKKTLQKLAKKFGRKMF